MEITVPLGAQGGGRELWGWGGGAAPCHSGAANLRLLRMQRGVGPADSKARPYRVCPRAPIGASAGESWRDRQVIYEHDTMRYKRERRAA